MGEQWLYQNRKSTYEDADTTSRSILCNNKLMSVSQNLYDGLTQILATDYHTETFWWIDQVCINQDDESEKRSQVRMMDVIYRQASNVVVWLGHGSAWEISGLKNSWRLIEGPPNDDIDDLTWNMDCICLYFALASVARRSWFKRVWIIQERMLGNNLTFFLGNHNIGYDDLYEAVHKAARTRACIGQARRIDEIFGFQELANFLGHRKHFQQGGVWTVEEWLTAVRGHSAYDGRDYFYGGLSLLSDNERATIKVDYSLSRDDIFSALTGYFLMNKPGINILSFAEQGLRLEDGPLPERPTWEINADRPTFRTPMIQLVYGDFSACPRSVSAEFDIDHGLLTTKAILLDELDIVCPEGLLDTGEGIEDLLKIILAMGTQYSWTDEHPLIALGTVLVADSGNDTNREVRISEVCQNMASFIATLAEFSKVRLWGQRATIKDPLASLRDWPLYKDFDWNTTWIRPEGLSPSTPLTAINAAPMGITSLITAATRRRRLFITKKGIIGLGPVTAKSGQTIAIVAGAQVPYIFNSVALGRLETYLDAWDKSCIERAKIIAKSHPSTKDSYHWQVMWNNIWQGVMGAKPFVEVMGREELKGYYRETRREFVESLGLDMEEFERIRGSRQLVGEGYLHGFMHGEVEGWMEEGGEGVGVGDDRYSVKDWCLIVLSYLSRWLSAWIITSVLQ